MKRKKLLHILDQLLDMGGRKQREHRNELKIVLKKLKKKKKDLKEEMLREEDKRKLLRLGKELEIVDAQRLKGLKALKELGRS